MKRRFDRRLVEIILGEDYLVYFNPYKKMLCRFIQPTACGYNFLELGTNKCILPTHLYTYKHQPYNNGEWFYVNKNMKIEKQENLKQKKIKWKIK